MVDVNPKIVGEVGDSSEIYSVVNINEAAGQIILFSEKPFEKDYSAIVNPEKLLVVINHPYIVQDKQLNFSFSFNKKESSLALFIIPNENTGVSIVASSSEITEVKLQNSKLEYVVTLPGEQTILWDKKNGLPVLEKGKGITLNVVENKEQYELNVLIENKKSKVVIRGILK